MLATSTGRLRSVLSSLTSPVESHPRLEAAGTKQIHSLFTEAELARTYCSVEALAAHPEVAHFVEWVAVSPRRLMSLFVAVASIAQS